MRHPPWWFFVIVLTAIFSILVASHKGWLPDKAVKGDRWDRVSEAISDGVDQAFDIGYTKGWKDGYLECALDSVTTVKGDEAAEYDPPGESP